MAESLLPKLRDARRRLNRRAAYWLGAKNSNPVDIAARVRLPPPSRCSPSRLRALAKHLHTDAERGPLSDCLATYSTLDKAQELRRSFPWLIATTARPPQLRDTQTREGIDLAQQAIVVAREYLKYALRPTERSYANLLRRAYHDGGDQRLLLMGNYLRAACAYPPLRLYLSLVRLAGHPLLYMRNPVELAEVGALATADRQLQRQLLQFAGDNRKKAHSEEKRASGGGGAKLKRIRAAYAKRSLASQQCQRVLATAQELRKRGKPERDIAAAVAFIEKIPERSVRRYLKAAKSARST